MTIHEIYNQIKKIDGWFTEEDVALIANLDLPKKPVILELGTHKGRSTKAWRLLYPQAEITTVDNLTKPDKKLIKELKVNFLFGGAGYAISWDKKIDVLFVDDDHMYNTVKKDIERFKPLIKKRGYMLFHDYAKTDVHKAVDELLEGVKAYTTGENSMAVWRKK